MREGLVSITFKKPEVSFKEILCEMNKFKMRYPIKAFKRLVIEVQDFGTIDPKSTGIGVENKVITLTLDTCPTRLEKAQLKKKEDDAYKANEWYQWVHLHTNWYHVAGRIAPVSLTTFHPFNV